MADNNIPNKLDSVKHEIKQQLFFECVIDSNNNILNLPKYQAIVDKLIQNREAEVRKNSSIDGVPLDREVVSVLMGEIAYLNEIKLHRHNLDTMKEQIVLIWMNITLLKTCSKMSPALHAKYQPRQKNISRDNYIKFWGFTSIFIRMLAGTRTFASHCFTIGCKFAFAPPAIKKRIRYQFLI